MEDDMGQRTDMDRKHYSWAEYYQQACEREKKKTESLMVKLYAEEKNRDELQTKYDKITGGVAWKCLDGLRTVRNACGKLAGGGESENPSGGGTEGESALSQEACGELLEAYQEELSRQTDPYSEWYQKKASFLKAEQMKTCTVSEKEAKNRCRVVAYREAGGVLEQLSAGSEKGEWPELPELILFAEDPDCLSADAPGIALSVLSGHPEAVIWYGDEDFQVGGVENPGRHAWPYFKPDWSPETLAGFFYFGSYVGIRTAELQEICAEIGRVEEGENSRKILYRLCLLLAWKALFSSDRDVNGLACHTALILYTGHQVPPARPKQPGVFENTNSEDYRPCRNYWGYEPEYALMKKDLLERFVSCGCVSGYTALEGVGSVYPVPENDAMPVVSVVIPSKDHADVLKNCISSFLEKTDYPDKKVEFIVVDNGSAEESRARIQAFLEEIQTHPLVGRTVYLYEKAPFNFSAMCNAGAGAAEGELLLLLNDDIEILVGDWLKILVGQSLFPGTGAVGAKLWYPECERIQHAGITNLAIGPSHKLITFPEDRLYYYGQGAVCMNMMAVTAACLLVRRDIYEKYGGLNEELAVAYNDVEFCFRLLKNGYRNVQRNDAVLCHHESLSRGRDDASDEKWDRLYAERRRLYDLYPEYEGYDPYYSPYLIQDLAEYVTGDSDPYVERLRTTECVRKVRQEELQPLYSDRMQLTVDRVLIQRKFRMDEPDILMAEGWCYLPGADNALYEPFLTLRSRDNTVYEFPVKVKYRYDVCAILAHEKNVGLAGFVCRVLKKELEQGTYQAGLLYRHRGTGQELWSESELSVEVTAT